MNNTTGKWMRILSIFFDSVDYQYGDGRTSYYCCGS